MLLAPPPLIYESTYRSASSPVLTSVYISSHDTQKSDQYTTDTQPLSARQHTVHTVNSTYYTTHTNFHHRYTQQQSRNSSAQINNSILIECCNAIQSTDTVSQCYLKLSEYIVYLASATSTTVATRSAPFDHWIEHCTSQRAVSISAPWLHLNTIVDVESTTTRQTSNKSKSHIDYDIACTIQSRATSHNQTATTTPTATPSPPHSQSIHHSNDPFTLNQANLELHNANVQAETLMPTTLFDRTIIESSPVVLLGSAMYDDKTNNSMADDPYFIYCFTERTNKQAPRSVACFAIQSTPSLQSVIYIENCYSTTSFTAERISSIQILVNSAKQHLQILQLNQQISSMQYQLKCRDDELVNIEAQAKASVAEAQIQAQHKTAFLSNMSHELRTPLNSVLGVVRLLASTDLNNEQIQYVEMLNSSGQLLLSIISDTLDFNKIDSNRLELEQREFSLLECVETSINMLHDMAVQKQLDLAYKFGDNVPRYVIGDSVRLQQIFLNLCSNSIKFSRQGYVLLSIDTVDIADSTTLSSISHDSTIDYNNKILLRFSVEDDGIGIAKDMQSKLFTSFTQAEHSTNRRFGGTGLGLAISKKLANAMGGDMKVDSVENVGSTFSFTVMLQKSNKHNSSVNSSDTMQQPRNSLEHDEHITSMKKSVSQTTISSIDSHSTHLPDTVHALNDSAEQLLDGKNVLIISDAHASNLQLRALLEPHHVNVTTVSDTFAAVSMLQLDNAVTPKSCSDEDNNAATFDFIEQSMRQVRSDTDKPKFDLIVHNSYRTNTSPQQLLGSLMRRLSISQLPYTILFIHAGRAALKRDINNDTDNSESPQFWKRQLDKLQLVEVTKPIKQRALLKTIAYLFDKTPSIAPTSPTINSSSQHSNPIINNELRAIQSSLSPAVINRTESPVYLPASPESSYSTLQSPLHANVLASSNGMQSPMQRVSPRTVKRTIKSNLTARTGLSSNKNDQSMQIKRMSSEMPLRILLAEDNVVGQKMLLMMLNKLGYSDVYTAIHGDGVLDLLDEHTCCYFDCILMDVNMSPGMDGLTCTRNIREHAKLCQAKCYPYIVAQTANVSTEFRDECGLNGMNDWVSKPVVLEQLCSALKRAYEHKLQEKLDDKRKQIESKQIKLNKFKQSTQ